MQTSNFNQPSLSVSLVGIIGGNDAFVEVLMTRGALSAFLPSNFWPVLRFQQYDYLHTRIIHSEIMPLIYLPCCISELLRNFHILKFVRKNTCAQQRKSESYVGHNWHFHTCPWSVNSRHNMWYFESYERGRFPHLPPSHHQAGSSSHEYNMRRTHDAT